MLTVPAGGYSAVQTISEWLASIGLSEYAQRFVENYVDPGVLPDLTDQDLRELGIPLGHRKKLLRAIAQFQGTAAGKLQPRPTRTCR